MHRLTFLFRTFAIILLMFSMASNSFSQEKKNGLRIGLHSAQLQQDGDVYFDKKNKSFYVGLFREQQAVGILKWRTGLEYHVSGSKDNDDNFVKLGYISIPASLGLDIGPVQVFGGASAAFKISTNETIAGVENDPTINDYDSFDATAFVGGTFSILFFAVELQYHWGLTNVTQDYRNQYLELGARVYF